MTSSRPRLSGVSMTVPWIMVLCSIFTLFACLRIHPLLTSGYLDKQALVFGQPGKPSWGVVMCAHDASTLELARTQIVALRKLFGMENVSFGIFHADEIDGASNRTLMRQVELLEITLNVKVESLSHWYDARFGNSTNGLPAFRGFFCKVGALLAAPFDVVAVVDLDVVLMSDPFRLMDTDIFRMRGHYLFRDVRTSVSEGTSHYTQQLRELWAHFHPDRPAIISKPLLNSPPFTGWSHDHGESALVLFDKARSHDALAILEEMVSPQLIDTTKRHVWGDKESYWQAVALAGHEPGMNPYSWAAIGNANEKRETCSYHGVLAQWVWLPGAFPRVFYINGHGVEELLAENDGTLYHSTLSGPLDYFSPRTNVHTYCSPGAVPLPTYVLDAIHAYKLSYHRSDMGIRDD